MLILNPNSSRSVDPQYFCKIHVYLHSFDEILTIARHFVYYSSMLPIKFHRSNVCLLRSSLFNLRPRCHLERWDVTSNVGEAH